MTEADASTSCSGVERFAAMEVSSGLPVNAEAQRAWEEASSSLRGRLHRLGLSPGGVAGLVLAAFGLGTLLLPSPRVPTQGEWAKSWSLVDEISLATARGSAELVPIFAERVATRVDSGVPFAVIEASASIKPGTIEGDPLALENVPDSLVVAPQLFERYALVLNKYPVFRGHSLLVTRDFQPQADRLSKWDLDALHRCVSAAHAVGFYNSHDVSGSSQPHRHMQLVPLASIAETTRLARPGIFDQIDALPHEFWRWSSRAPFFPVVRRLEAFRHIDHGLVRLPSRATFDIDFARDGSFADALLRAYALLATDLGVFRAAQDQLPYNLLLHTDWILLVRRAKPAAFGLSVNGLAFVAILLARDPRSFDRLLDRDDDDDRIAPPSVDAADQEDAGRFGPLAVLEAVSARPAASSTGAAPESTGTAAAAR
mmetsp:Transcript_8299/g.25730  ORF Transcript_8299/g.25730 Transcript_8299/m.25730 type:complete len:428 (-) Transcript_8299:241-1524(-)